MTDSQPLIADPSLRIVSSGSDDEDDDDIVLSSESVESEPQASMSADSGLLRPVRKGIAQFFSSFRAAHPPDRGPRKNGAATVSTDYGALGNTIVASSKAGLLGLGDDRALFMCLVVDNPFDVAHNEDFEWEIADESVFKRRNLLLAHRESCPREPVVIAEHGAAAQPGSSGGRSTCADADTDAAGSNVDGAVLRDEDFLRTWSDASSSGDDDLACRGGAQSPAQGTTRWFTHRRLRGPQAAKKGQLRSGRRPFRASSPSPSPRCDGGHADIGSVGAAAAEATATHIPTLVPTKFQKLIELLLRLERRGVEYHPRSALTWVAEHLHESRRASSRNFFRGFELNEGVLMYSPDRDECYFKLYASRKTLLAFAEQQNLILVTNAYSFAGGAGLTYTHALEERLARSVFLYARCFPVPHEFLGPRGRGWGFRVDIPQRMRLTARLVREGWGFGGCGIQLEELRRQGAFVRNFFPLHNRRALATKTFTRWASLGQLVTTQPLLQDHMALARYFGEAVALYFMWVREYALFLRWAALLGLVAGILDIASVSTAVVNAAFGLFLTLWSFTWCRTWRDKELAFASALGQTVEQEQQLVRDGFTPDSPPEAIKVDDVMELRFSFPLTIVRRSDGTIMHLASSPRRRRLIRVLVTYPATFLMTSALVTALTWVTVWRMRHIENQVVKYSASALATACSLVFGKIFDIIVPLLNRLENNRTEHEEHSQLIAKAFFFHFFSSYFPLLSIMLYPTDSSSEAVLRQMSTQLLFICVAKPMVQNAQEIALPLIGAELRKRVDLSGGSYWRAFMSIMCCRSKRSIAGEFEWDEGALLWQESQRECYESTADDFLEMVLQFGFMSMFATVFPWAGVAALVYSIMELRVDAIKLCRYMQRPMAHTARTIGAWHYIMWLMTAASVVTNSYLIVVLSPLPQQLHLIGEDGNVYLCFVMVQYSLVVLMGAIYWATGETGATVEKREAKHKLLSERAIRVQLMTQLRKLAHDTTLFPEGSSDMPTLAVGPS